MTYSIFEELIETKQKIINEERMGKLNMVVRTELQNKMSKLDVITIRDIEDNLDIIRFNHHKTCFHCGHESIQDVEIYRPHFDEYEGYWIKWAVIFSGAVDFEGNKKDMLKRYPEFKNITTDL